MASRDRNKEITTGIQGGDSSFVPYPSALSPWPHRIAVTTACATVPLLFIGGLVTSKGAGLAVPDWPTSFGYNMFLYPWSKMVGNIFYEHSHRLFASAVGFLTIVLAVTFWFKEDRPWVRWLALGALGLVIAQGIVGGLRVVLLENTLAMLHASLAQAFFALTVMLATLTSADWRHSSGKQRLQDGRWLCRLSAALSGLLYLQAVLGAIVRHTGERFEFHFAVAAVIAVLTAFVMARIQRLALAEPKLTFSARLLGGLLVLQLMLGIGSYITKFTTIVPSSAALVVLITTTHLLIGAVMLATSLFLTLRSFRLSARGKNFAGVNSLQEQYST